MDKRTYDNRKDYYKEYYKDYYEKNPEYKEKQKARAKEREQKNRQAYTEWKKTLECSRCGENESCCLEFHHTDPTQKDYTVSQIAGKSMAFILKEVAKCIVVCSNCHKKIHAGVG